MLNVATPLMNVATSAVDFMGIQTNVGTQKMIGGTNLLNVATYLLNGAA